MAPSARGSGHEKDDEILGLRMELRRSKRDMEAHGGSQRPCSPSGVSAGRGPSLQIALPAPTQ